jgi:presenilin-like A22 family membrane protease
MDHRDRMIIASAGVVLMFVAVQLGALALVEPFQEEGHQVVEDSEDPSWSLYYILAIFVATAVMLGAINFGGTSFLRVGIIFAGVYIAFYVFQALLPPALSVTYGGAAIDLGAIVLSLAIGAALYFYPEWYVIDVAGIIMGIGAAGLFGVNLSVLPIIVLLIALAVYDAISVYGTEHMLTLASGAMDMRVPVVLIVPLSLSYSFLESDGPMALEEHEADDGEDMADEDGEEGIDDGEDGAEDDENPAEVDDKEEANDVDEETNADADEEPIDAERLRELGPEGVAELADSDLTRIDPAALDELDDELREEIEAELPKRDALFIGLGDAVMPTLLVASAAFFVDTGAVSLLGVSATLPALTAMVGTIAGLVALLWLVAKGRAHAGLPLLNGGAIAGYLIGALLSGLTVAEALGIAGYF